MTLLPARAGNAPAEPGAPSAGPDTGLLVTARSTKYRIEAWSSTELDDSSRFARWLMIPQ